MSVIDLFQVTFKAANGLSKFHAVGQSAADDYTVANTGTEALGIVQRDVASGQSAPVMLHGISRGVVGASVTRGQRVTNGGSGFLVAATSGAIPTPVLGRALTSAASGMISHIFIDRTITVSGAAN